MTAEPSNKLRSDALLVDSAIPINSLILKQTAPECQLGTPLYHLPHAARLFPRLHFAHAHSHFFVQANSSPLLSTQCCATCLALQAAIPLSLHSRHLLLQHLLLLPQYILPAPLYRHISIPSRLYPLCHHLHPCPGTSASCTCTLYLFCFIFTTAPFSTCDLCDNDCVILDSGLSPHSSSVPRPSRRRKHKRRARAAAALKQARNEDDNSLGPPLATIQHHQHLTVVYYWNTNGHLTQHSTFTTVQLICHLSADVCVLHRDSRISTVSTALCSTSAHQLDHCCAPTRCAHNRLWRFRHGSNNISRHHPAALGVEPSTHQHLRPARGGARNHDAYAGWHPSLTH